MDDSRLSLVGVCTSGGAGPVSLTYRDGLLYVLNAANASTAAANVAGFRVDATGQLHPIAGATRPPSTAHPNPAQVQLDPQAAPLPRVIAGLGEGALAALAQLRECTPVRDGFNKVSGTVL